MTPYRNGSPRDLSPEISNIDANLEEIEKDVRDLDMFVRRQLKKTKPFDVDKLFSRLVVLIFIPAMFVYSIFRIESCELQSALKCGESCSKVSARKGKVFTPVIHKRGETGCWCEQNGPGAPVIVNGNGKEVAE